MKKYFYTALLATAIVLSTAAAQAQTYNNREDTNMYDRQVNAVMMDQIHQTDTGLGIVYPKDLRRSQIRIIQHKLKDANYFSAPIDGVWNSSTDSAVQRFQRDKGLIMQGVGPLTTSTVAQLGLEVDVFRELQQIAPAGGGDN